MEVAKWRVIFSRKIKITIRGNKSWSRWWTAKQDVSGGLKGTNADARNRCFATALILPALCSTPVETMKQTNISKVE